MWQNDWGVMDQLYFVRNIRFLHVIGKLKLKIQLQMSLVSVIEDMQSDNNLQDRLHSAALLLEQNFFFLARQTANAIRFCIAT